MSTCLSSWSPSLFASFLGLQSHSDRVSWGKKIVIFVSLIYAYTFPYNDSVNPAFVLGFHKDQIKVSPLHGRLYDLASSSPLLF